MAKGDVLSFLKTFSDESDTEDYRSANQVLITEVVPTGSIALDVALGCGGWPKGRITQVYGPTASGKTFLCLIGIKQAQKVDPDAQQIWIDAEQTFNPKWAEEIGIDLSILIIIDREKAQNGRECFEILLGVPKEDAKTHAYVGKKQNGLFDEIASGSLNINFVVLDSLGAIIPPIDDVAIVGKSSMAALPRFLSKELKRVSLDVRKANIPLLIINHVKSNMDPYSGGSDHTFSGGNSYAHFLSANVFVKPLTKKETQIFDEKENKMGHTVKAVIEKTKFGPWPRVAEFKFDFRSGIVDVHEELVAVALDKDVILKPTSKSYEFNNEKWVGMPDLLEGVKNNQELQLLLSFKIMENLKKKNVKVESEVQEEVETEEKRGPGRKKKNKEE